MKIVVSAFLLLTVSSITFAQNPVSNANNSSLDTSVPASPAFTILGLTPNTITRPASPRKLATSLLNGVDQNGNFQAGIAIDTAPYMLIYGNGITLQNYRNNRVVRFLARTEFSLATAKGASESDKSARIATGLHFTIFDRGDPRTDKTYAERLAAVATQILEESPPLSPTASQADIDKRKKEIEEKVLTASKSIREEYERRSWNRSSWVIAAATSWISPDGTTSRMVPDGAAVWTSLAYGFENVPGLQDHAQAILYGRFHGYESIPDPENPGEFYRQQSTFAGGRFRFGDESTIGSFEAVYVHTRPVNLPTQRYFRMTIGAEKRLTDNVWLHFGIGGESGVENGQNKFFILGAFNWGAGPK